MKKYLIYESKTIAFGAMYGLHGPLTWTRHTTIMGYADKATFADARDGDCCHIILFVGVDKLGSMGGRANLLAWHYLFRSFQQF